MRTSGRRWLPSKARHSGRLRGVKSQRNPVGAPLQQLGGGELSRLPDDCAESLKSDERHLAPPIFDRCTLVAYARWIQCLSFGTLFRPYGLAMAERMKTSYARASSFGGVPISVALLLAVLTICGGIRLLPRVAESGSRGVMVLVAAIIVGLVLVPMLPKRKRKRKRKARESKTK